MNEEKNKRMNSRTPAEVFRPGDLLADELVARDWSQTELAEILGRPPRVVNEIIAGKRAITPETAMGLAAALGTSAQFWMNMESSYQLSKAHIADQEVSRRAKLYGTFPVKELLKRGWIEASENIDVLEQRFFQFFDMETWTSKPTFTHAAKSTTYEGTTVLKLAWLNRAKYVAKAVSAGKYSESLLRDAIKELRACMENVEEIRKVSSILSKVGVRLVIVEHLAGSKMDGACFWLTNSSPVIALSLRFDRVDNFWFVLFHEIDHVLNGEGKGDDPIYEIVQWNLEGLAQNEMRANQAAGEHCIPSGELEGFIARVNPLFTKQAVIGFARRIHVHPGIVVGQLQYRGLIPYSYHKEMLEKVRTIVTTSVLVDGFGNKISL